MSGSTPIRYWVNPTSSEIIAVTEDFAVTIVETPATFGLTSALVASYATTLASSTGNARKNVIAQIESDEDIMPTVLTSGWVAVTMVDGSPKFHAANLRPVRNAIVVLRDAGILTV